MALAITLIALPATCLGHAFDERYDLPAPLSFFVAGAALTVALSFVVIAWAARGSLGSSEQQRSITLGALLPALRRVLQAIAVLLLLLVFVAGAIGDPHPGENIAPTLVWVVWWVGLSLFAAVIGNPWPVLDPWRALFDATDAIARKLGAANGLSLHQAYPAAFGAWPAVLFLLLFAWVEVVFPRASDPSRIALWTWPGPC